MNAGLVVILTALDLEYDAVRTLLTDVRRTPRNGTQFEVGRLPGGAGRVALALAGKGTHPAGILTERAIREFSPVAVMFVGVAGARRSRIALGDVVVATHVYAYHGATAEDDGAKARPRTWEASHSVDQIARYVARDGAWLARLSGDRRAPQVHFGPIASGEVVHNSTTSYEAEWLRQHYSDALAVEMEAAGAAQAAHLNETPAVVVRGISDRADGTKQQSDGGGSQPRAAAHAAAFAVRVAEELVVEGDSSPMSENEAPGTVTNFAAGNVGMQAGNITGSTVWVGAAATSPAVDLGTLLTALDGQLQRARTAGQLDEATWRAAHTELETASTAMRGAESDRKNTVVLALKKLQGLVSDVAELATALAAAVVAAKGLS